MRISSPCVADDIGEADVIELGQFHLQFARDAAQPVGRPMRGSLGFGRERQDDDRHIVDAAADDQRLGHADRDAVHVGADLLVHAQDRRVGTGADEEARRHHGAIVPRLRIDVLDAVDALDDGLERLGDQLHRIFGLETVGADMDVDHRHRDLRLFLARQGDQGHEAHSERGKQKERRQRRSDEGLGQLAGDAEPHVVIGCHGTSTRSPGLRPDRISTRGPSADSKVSPMMTGTSIAAAAPCTFT